MRGNELALPLWMTALNMAAALCLGLGVVRLFVPSLSDLLPLPEPIAWVLLMVGISAMVLWWVAFLRHIAARKAAGR
ncbi:MAG: hypothetical protein LKM32_05355 [Chiayiivirga sp.]|jgi:hypothetical protein|uniref:hypothetical protein n=1 Tax=Chiayiivirga sp. TaxID=2041042 RepID=UPI0025C24B13|nr:hypothetical protein [Chiayiivirga sp.]MCI1728823.1 hypothetical protein [Chiayiivirga sp.]